MRILDIAILTQLRYYKTNRFDENKRGSRIEAHCSKVSNIPYLYKYELKLCILASLKSQYQEDFLVYRNVLHACHVC